MALLEKDEEELLQRRLEEEIRANVESKLFRYYRNVGSVIITILSLVGISIGWPALQSLIESTIETQISEQVQEPVTKAQGVASQAEELARTSRQAVEIGLELIRDKQSRITDTLGKLDARSDDLNSTFSKVYAQIDKLNQNAEELQQRMKTFNEQFKFNLATQDDISAINRDLTSLAERSRDLAVAVQRIKGITGSSSENITSSFDQVASEAKERSEMATTTKSTVYVQFAVGRREDIKFVSEKLKAKEWLIPGEERTSKADGLKEIRYFHVQDRPAADKLAEDTNTALDEIGFDAISVVVKDYTKFPKPPRQGVLELWVSIPLR